MFAGLNVLGFIFNSRKYLLAFGIMAVLWGVALEIIDFYHEWHTKPMFELKSDLKAIKEELRICKNSKAVEVFVTENRSVFNSYRERIEELNSEEFNVTNVDNNSYEWMYE
ncbi:hypothetical protein MNB_SV-14-1026 [hydrothermal vent metagenome]|uniref:Uncharacterized protein n=1 Tax=hydrothermal vent metagenome TaxID=652676 RepID=A0A1W1CCK5_9ZZZZ